MADDNAARNEYYRQWRQRNPEKTREYADRRRRDPETRRKDLERLQQWQEANPEQASEARARYRQANREHVNECTRQWKRDNAGRKRVTDAAWRAANPDRVRAMGRRADAVRKTKGYKSPDRVRRRELTARLWDEQDGCCYLCARPVELERAVLDHDHRCCPLDAYCSYCIRGVACNPCNQAIGILDDDPDLLELVARNLRAKLAEVDERRASKPEQLTLD